MAAIDSMVQFAKSAIYDLRAKAASALAPNTFVGSVTLPWESTWRALWPEDFRRNAVAYREWAYTCTRIIADGVSAVPLKLYVAKNKKSKTALASRPVSAKTYDSLLNKSALAARVAKAADIVEVMEHPFLDLMKNVNPFSNRFDLIDGTIINLELMGNSYWYKRRDMLGVVRELWVIPAQYMWVVPSPETFIKGYVMQRLAYGQIGSFVVPFEEADIIHYKYADPNNLYYGISPLAAVSDAYNTQMQLNTYTGAMFKNMARPDGVVSTDATLSEADFDRAKKMFQQQYGGNHNTAKAIIMDNGMKFTPTTFKPVDMGKKDTSRDVLERMAAAFRVPLAKIITENVNKANAEAAQEDFLRDTVVPRLARIEEKINEKLMPEYGDEYFVAFENPVKEDKEARIKERTENIRVGYSTRNEERALDGLPPLKIGGDDLPALDGIGTGAVSDGELVPSRSLPIIPIDNPASDDEDLDEDEAAKEIERRATKLLLEKITKRIAKKERPRRIMEKDAQPITVNIAPPAVNITMPDISVAPPVANIHHGDVHFAVDGKTKTKRSVERNNDGLITGIINEKSIQKVERDENGLIMAIVETDLEEPK